MTTPLLEGLDGVNKMSKSLGNYIGIAEPADEMFGKLMSISDELMWRYFELLSFRPAAEIDSLRRAVAEGRNPRDVKFELGVEIVERFHGGGAGAAARDAFVARFQQGALPEHIDEVTLQATDGAIGIGHLLRNAGLVASTSEAMRQIRQGAVRVDGQRIEDAGLVLAAGGTYLLQVGKRRIAKVHLSR
jgi:tyrosyl-tRNA synthetase